VIEDVIGFIVDVVEGVIRFFTEDFVLAIENVGVTWGQIWTAVGGFFEGLWNGILQFFGGVVGTIIGVIANVAEAAAGIPGPWQEGARQQAAALRGMQANVETWGTEVNRSAVTSYETMRRNAADYAGRTGDAWAAAFEGRAQVIANAVARGLEPARGILRATSPPESPRNPLHDIDLWAGRTADAYGEAFAARGGAIAAAVRSALAPAADVLKPDIQGSFVGSNTQVVSAMLDVRISGDPAAIAALPGGAAGVAAELRRGLDMTGMLRELRHDVSIR